MKLAVAVLMSLMPAVVLAQSAAAPLSLEEAIALGFKDVARLKSEDAFAGLIDDPRYQKLIANMINQ